jgi:hypothetical protein
MSSGPLLSINLKNGLTLLGWDQSKKITADHWHVCVMVEITIPVEEKWFGDNPMDEETFKQIKDELGDAVVFQQKRERPFIRVDQKDKWVNEICRTAEETGVKYLGRDDFAAKYILKAFTDQQRRRRG